MGWRVNWYRANKNEPVKKIQHEDWTEWVVNGEIVGHNNGTEFWTKLKRENEDFQKEIKCLVEHSDLDIYSITKEGFKMIILAYRQKVIDYMKDSLDLYNHPEDKDMKKHWFTVDLVKEWERELHEWEATFLGDNNERCYFNIDLNKPKDKFGISGSWMYKFAIFDMIEIYKYFDWENNIMVVYGG